MPAPDVPGDDPADAPGREAPAPRRAAPMARTRQVRGPGPGDDPLAAPREEPWLPHDHDESAHAASDEPPPEVGRRAYADLERGLVDTDRQPVMERVYRRQKEEEEDGGGRPEG